MHALRPAYELGAAERGRDERTWVVIVLMIVACAASFSLAAIMLGVPKLGGAWVEAPVPAGAWAFEWSGNVAVPAAAQAEQVRALRLVAAGAAALVSVLSLLTLFGLWRQRLLLRWNEYFVHWAVGARKLQTMARLAGEARSWVAGALALTLLAAAVGVALIERSFPGAAPLGSNIAATLIVLTGLAVLVARWESRAGRESTAPVRDRLWELAASPAMIGAVGFAALTGAGLLALHAPGDRMQTAEARGTMVGASLAGLSPESRGEEILGWTERARDTGEPVGFASAGAARATGRTDFATVECGHCWEALMPAPLKIVSAEVHAVAPDTFTHLGVAVEEGRDFDNATDRGAPSVAIVSAALAGRHFENGEPLGRRLRVGDSGWLTVVGVVSDRSDVQNHQDYAIYLPLAQAAPEDIEVLVDGSPGSLGPILAAAPQSVTLTAPRSRAEIFSSHGWFRGLLALLGWTTMALVAVGLFTSAANESSAARYEVAVRRAIGATRRSFWWYYVSFAGKRLAVALILGAWLSLFLGAGLNLAYPPVPQVDGSVWLVGALWISFLYVVGSLRPVLRAANAAIVPGLGGGPT
jgi:hypothetical protein